MENSAQMGNYGYTRWCDFSEGVFAMVPPISLGTLLRQRYLIQAILGQGGFGRTYLATDQERFDERCVLKEFSVPYQDEVLIKKSQTLFQREASTLYQIQHPQVPRFWAAFEEGQRLFLVQDFVEGQTYRHLLHDRCQQGEAFSEIEVLYFLQQVLPVLTYLHDRGIIHRDLSPENIILKPDNTPVSTTPSRLTETGVPIIIDFGAVKEATTHWSLTSAITRVGKVGYAPPEQLQTGQVYPSSDLYYLAATCLVLLTGKEPRSLVDSQTLEWRWQPYTQISDDLARILKRMLSVYPGDRYASAQDVLRDLQPRLAPSKLQPLAESSSAALPQIYPEALSSTLLTSDTSIQPTSSQRPFNQFNPYATNELRSSATQPGKQANVYSTISQRLRLGMAAAFLLGTGVAGTWFWQKWTSSPAQSGDVWVSGAKLPRSEASKIIDPQGTLFNNSIQHPSTSPNNGEPSLSTRTTSPQIIEFSAEKVATTLEGNLPDGMSQSYLFNASKGQILTTTLHGASVVMNVLHSNQDGIDAAAYQTRSWTGQLPADGQYLIQVSGSGGYTLDVAITPVSRPIQDRTDRISFARGTNGTTVTGSIVPKQIRRYLLKANQGQLVLVKVIQGNANFSAIAPNGQRLGGSTTHSNEWKGQLPMAGDYVIEVSAAQPGDFALALEVF
ncbi:MAG: serine/threonine-protein kinase [Leptolyngbyaceae cyanobacterium bins.302]|nr:serine/threonine-protein kinase [Leptolyngbyaceae cyanobacterium bins.302]